jgi:hypothetical protein
LEDSEDRRSVGGHGNQHVRLRIAQVDHIETFCPALAALCCFEPRQTSGAGFRPAEDFRTSPRETARPAERRCIDGLAGSVDAVRRLAAQALAFAPQISCCRGRAGTGVAADRNPGIFALRFLGCRPLRYGRVRRLSVIPSFHSRRFHFCGL